MWGRSINREVDYIVRDIRDLKENVFDLMADVAQIKTDFEAAMSRVAADTTKQINDAIIAAQANFQSAQQAALDALDAEINAVSPAPVVVPVTPATDTVPTA